MNPQSWCMECDSFHGKICPEDLLTEAVKFPVAWFPPKIQKASYAFPPYMPMWAVDKEIAYLRAQHKIPYSAPYSKHVDGFGTLIVTFEWAEPTMADVMLEYSKQDVYFTQKLYNQFS